MAPTKQRADNGRPQEPEGDVTDSGRLFGSMLSFRREQLGLSQEELAAKTGTSVALIKRVERGSPSTPAQMRQFTSVLRVEPEEGLVGGLLARASAGGTRAAAAVRHLSLPSGRRWALLAVPLLVLLVVVAVGAFGSRGANAVPDEVPTAAAPPGVLAAVKKANAEALRARLAERKAAAERAERRAAVRKAAAAARQKEATAAAAAESSASDQSSSEIPIVPPAAPPPAPSGGGGSSKPASPPGAQHGIRDDG